MSARERWPARVYGEGDEPDYRFSLANERTFLAWLRTGLALLAAGVAIDVLDLSLGESETRVAAVVLLVLGVLAPVLAWLRWAAAERAMRRREPLPGLGVAAGGVAGLMLLTAVVLLVLVGL
ncbi:DUF202 domain-containing protein [Janibacter melonis]|uniref:DUF202 domain-containing protein n=1 Tax=Janibacter melonis TaxID=262209 RepID=A0A5P8FJJ2_9MICO|nr:DUF202 domain-containing protein [Janibacter melonis]QFQ29331.2 DUF202 domain-containing protein [Janibacter melonis]